MYDRGMKSTVVSATGSVRCPNCGAYSFRAQRTAKAKLAGVAVAGIVGLAVMPKRLKCDGCGTNLRRGRTPSSVELAPLARAIVTAVVAVGLAILFLAH
jgi:hypothetical protein